MTNNEEECSAVAARMMDWSETPAPTGAATVSQNAPGSEGQRGGSRRPPIRGNLLLKRLEELSSAQQYQHQRYKSDCPDDIMCCDADDTSLSDGGSAALAATSTTTAATATEESAANFVSPAESQVSMGSVASTLTAALLPRHCDLTPVARNTSSSAFPNDAVLSGTATQHSRYRSVGERLAVPLAEEDDPYYGSAASSSMDAALPSLGPSPASLGHMGPVPFPTSRKFFSFTSRQQYQEALEEEEDEDDELLVCLSPYQPSRQEALGDYGSLPSEELDSIFISRRQSSGYFDDSVSSQKTHRMMTEEDEEAAAASHPQRLQRGDIRHNSSTGDYSIPSLRHANHLHGSSTATNSNSLTDDDAFDDGGSVSSKGSLEAEAGAADSSRTRGGGSSRRAQIRAFEWLQSVEADHNILAEAASSKFLMQARHRVPNLHPYGGDRSLSNHPSHRHHNRRASAVADKLASC